MVGKLSPGDLKSLLSQLMEGAFRFLHEHGPVVFFATSTAVTLTFLAVWAIRKLVDGKQAEIDRISDQRDKFQKLIIDDWKTTMKKGPKK